MRLAGKRDAMAVRDKKAGTGVGAGCAERAWRGRNGGGARVEQDGESRRKGSCVVKGVEEGWGTGATRTCDPFVFLPAFAMLRRPGFVWRSWKFSSATFLVSARIPGQQSTTRTGELLAVDALPAGAVAAREVAALEHELPRARVSISRRVKTRGNGRWG
jgi:hypothetical protein